MDETSRTPQPAEATYPGETGETFYLGYQRNGQWQWRRLTAGRGDEDVRAVFLVRPDGSDWPQIPNEPEDANGVAGFARQKPPATSLEQTDQPEGGQTMDASAGALSLCYWIDGKLYCDHASQ